MYQSASPSFARLLRRFRYFSPWRSLLSSGRLFGAAFPVHSLQVRFDGVEAEAHAACDLRAGASLGGEPRDLILFDGQTERNFRSACSGSPRWRSHGSARARMRRTPSSWRVSCGASSSGRTRSAFSTKGMSTSSGRAASRAARRDSSAFSRASSMAWRRPRRYGRR